ncbi:squalene/phytoene synthase family protein [Microbacterium hominis]|uniref:phytoene/squalene synthase family protein n=1 Tax=Microbacterium TaxID=33882 RepID=UPI00168A4493|nr:MULTISPECIES: squalene/phytoene synthase family protein [Microbacterium]QOC25243.1 squalene/phytoene synthase family protein [Microbacterium hominis]QOC29268.1 squalene/phytoene synthase family protein [Microbacterium hominis]QYF98528.1 squalene/phytoene synthase family protein [Microbacterium sp. PAMC21962]
MSGAPAAGGSLYDRCAQEAAATVIAAYSTSFALACRLLGPRVRTHVRSIYALVRVADEVVDGAAEQTGLPAPTQRLLLDELEAETLAAVARGFSTNLIVHAFALAARECGIGHDLVRPFFASMRTDLTRTRHDDASHDEYVYGSAEVVGLMCLQVFVNAGRATPLAPDPGLVDGARRLGAAFQDVNFLRDRTDDENRLGRDYLGLQDGRRDRTAVLDRIDADLDAAAAAIADLPADCRRAVTTAHGLFAELAHRLREDDDTARVSVPAPVKATIAARALAGRPPKRSTP